MVTETEAVERRVVLQAEVNELDDATRLSFAVDPGSRHAIDGTFIDVHRHMTRTGRNRIARAHHRCVGETLLVDEIEWIEGRTGREIYEPPIPALTWPIERGATWDWTGQLRISDVVPPMAARATFHVHHVLEVRLIGRTWRVAAITSRLAVTPTPGADEQVMRTTTVFAVEPWFAVLHRERWLGDDAIEPVQRFAIATGP